MSATRKIALSILLAILLAGLGYWLYQHYKNIKGPHASALEAIHPEVVFFAQSDDVRAAFYKLTTETDYWPALMGDSLFIRFRNQLGSLDSLVSSSGWLNEVIELHRFTISFNRNPEGRYGFLFLQELPPGDFTPSFEDFIKKVNGARSLVMKREFEKAVIQTVNLTAAEELFYFSVYKGLFIGSYDESLVQASILQLNGKWSLLKEESFRRIHSTAGKNVEANIYVHLPYFIRWAGNHLSGNYKDLTDKMVRFGSWSEIDLLVNDEDLLFNGYTITNDSATMLLDRFRHAPQSIRVPEILPSDVAWMMHWGIAGIKEFLSASRSHDELVALLSGYEKDFGIDLENEFISWIGHEVVLAAVRPEGDKPHPMVIVHTEDVVRAVLALGEMEKKVNRKNRTQPFLMTHNDYNIRKLGLNRLFSDLFGGTFPLMEDCYYVTLKDYVVFSSYERDLVQVIDQFYGQKTLLSNAQYQTFSDNISDRSNIYIYCNLRHPDPALDEVLEGTGTASFVRSMKLFEGFALQFSYINGMFYTNMFLRYNPEYHTVAANNWSADLEAEVAGKPYLVENHRNGKTNIVVFDKSNNMYLLDHVGRKQWQLALVEAPLGAVFMVDYYGNGKQQYLFNTENYVYLVDLNGNYVADFPKKLMAPATNSLAVFDYERDGNYRLLIALNDNKIHNFTLQLSPVDGWEKVQAKASVEEPLQYLRNGGKDYLLFTDNQGQVKITDRRGRERISPRSQVDKSVHSAFHINRTNSKGLFLTTDRKGKVVYIDEKGKVSRTDFGDFEEGHYFFYEDFDGDDHLDFIFVDRNRLVVYDRFKNTITQQQFPEVITRPPVLFSWAGRRYLGVVLDAAGEIQIFDHQGRRFQELHFDGSLPFATGSLEQGKLNLITGKGMQVQCFQLN